MCGRGRTRLSGARRTPSMLALSKHVAFLDMLWVSPIFSRRLWKESCWYCQPWSECRIAGPFKTGSSPSGISIVWAKLGLLDTDQATISLLQRSITGERYALPPATLNSVTSVASFSIGPLAEESRFKTFLASFPCSPLEEL